MFSSVFGFYSCSDNGPDDSLEWKWKKIVRSNINEAQYLFNTPTDGTTYSPSLRSYTNQSDFGIIDVNGMVKDIQFFDEDGELVGNTYQPPIIHGIVDVGDYIICGMTLNQNVRTEETNSKGEIIVEGWRAEWLFCNLLINKKTGVVYMLDEHRGSFGSHVSFIQWHYYDDIKGYSDARGNLYLGYQGIGNKKISKINIQDPDNVSIEDYLPVSEMDNLLLSYGNSSANLNRCFFSVNPSGICAYTTYTTDEKLKLKCPGGRIYPIEQLIPDDALHTDHFYYHLFMGHNSSYYIATSKYVASKIYPGAIAGSVITIYKLLEPTNNEILSEQVAELTSESYYGSQIRYSVKNPEKGTRIWSLGNKLVEFSEKENTIIDTAIEIPTIQWGTHLFYTSSMLYIGSDSFQRLTQISFNDYSDQKIVDFQSNGYEAYDITSSMSSELTFTGLRYTDANYIIGIVDAAGNINSLESTAQVNEKTILIRMN